MKDLINAALAVCDRWDSPDWKEQEHTGELIKRLRDAVAYRDDPVYYEVAPEGGGPIVEIETYELNEYKRDPRNKIYPVYIGDAL